ncbi:hypothetical protein KUTeg_007692 [Tegillarca granosa]|uniref:Splicing factor YJU2 n=1 Tax=Tegillarca granosa TaxID=220873 RepID=A0ABQ9FG94_TEGGR|nr:hypothetical protein KUTeg_007692 [Tegillarca granosa]
MSERKVLNKYYPPDFDPSAIPKMKTRGKNVPFNIRLMAPFNMRCNTCGVYIYKGKKFNSRKEDTDIKRQDYELEAGATRLFEAEKLAQEMAERERQEKEDEELNNPMKVLENRTKASRNEIEQIDMLEELREMNARQANIDHEKMLELHKEYEVQLKKLQDEEEEKEIRAIFGQKEGKSIKRLQDDSDSDEEPVKKKQVIAETEKPTDILSSDAKLTKSENKKELWNKSIGGFSSKKNLLTLVKKKSNSADCAKIQEKTKGLNNKSNAGISSSLSAIKGSDKDNSNKALTSNVTNKNENKTDSTGINQRYQDYRC